MDTLEAQIKNGGCLEEEISLSTFHAAAALKSKIRQTIVDYQQRGCELTCIFIQGSCLHLKFKPKNVMAETRR